MCETQPYQKNQIVCVGNYLCHFLMKEVQILK